MYFNKKLNPYSLFNVNGRSCVTFNRLNIISGNYYIACKVKGC